MTALLSTSKNFIEDVKKIEDKIKNTEDENKKKEAQKLLNQLVSEVRSIDTQHNDLIFYRKQPSGMSDTREKIKNIRKKLDKLLS